MRVVVVYESEFGATRGIADAIGRGLRAAEGPDIEVEVIDSREVTAGDGWIDDVDLLVVGAPTHARSLPTPASRQQAQTWPDKPGSRLRLEPAAAADGMREWLTETDLNGLRVATFTTRMDMARILTGSAGPALGRLIGRAGGAIMAGPQEFLVAKDGSLVDHELDHAYDWGRVLGAAVAEPVGSEGRS